METNQPTTSADVRASLVDALRLDLVGPEPGQPTLGNLTETLDQFPSRWYLTGFLVPTDAGDEQRQDEEEEDELEQAGESGGLDDSGAPDKPSARRAKLPSSMGLSILISAETRSIDVLVRWGDYLQQLPSAEQKRIHWKRSHHDETVTVELPDHDKWRKSFPVPNSRGLELEFSLRSLPDERLTQMIPAGTRSLSVFLVNRRTPASDERQDEAFAFQTMIEVRPDQPLVAKPNLRSLESDEWDVRVADLQYRDCFEFGVGHNISTSADVEDTECRTVRTRWIPEADVEKVSPTNIEDVELGMEPLGLLRDYDDAQAKLSGFVTAYRTWIEQQRANLAGLNEKRTETAQELLDRAGYAAERLAKGISLLEDDLVRDAFCIANRAMAAQAKRRLAREWGAPIAEVFPNWRPFQLAFVLLNLEGIVDPKSADRNVVDLLFFPTGGGKTEAYLGLAAFTLVLRRLRNPGIRSAGLTVLMRYTLRLLTLDQLGRAAALICALELEREKDAEKLGDWPFEIALWVGQAATPNVMGRRGDKSRNSARAKTIAFKNDDQTKPSPIPIESCPWCDQKFDRNSFTLTPNSDSPDNLLVSCANLNCDFSQAHERHLPIVAVDEPIYRRLPCFMIATVDKFAAMPWTGPVGQFFGNVDRSDQHGFYGPCDRGEGQPLPDSSLLPPELIIQDELHLISGPLGTIAGLYETAIDVLSRRDLDGRSIGPKIIASTATVRRAETQIRALFGRASVDIFPPPGPDRRDSFFAQTDPPDQSNPRLYVALAAPGRSPKKIYLKAQLCLMAAAEQQYRQNRDEAGSAKNPADPYMTVLNYFNSLRELGGARRIVEDEISIRLSRYGQRKRVGEATGIFQDREFRSEVVELTSRVSTADVAKAKRRLELEFDQPGKKAKPVDVALATNMISVGLDITRLGLMLVFGQPKTTSEYIQSTSRVGRDEKRPGLVVTVLNNNRPRDRSHYERFSAFHESFYRHVEATSVTPFSPRAMDRALAGTLVALARQGHQPMTPPTGAEAILNERSQLDFVIDELVARAEQHQLFAQPSDSADLQHVVRERCKDLFDTWTTIVSEYHETGTRTQYQREVGDAKRLLHEFLHPDLNELHPRHKKFRANRSMRDVEPEVNLWLKTLNNQDLEDSRNG